MNTMMCLFCISEKFVLEHEEHDEVARVSLPELSLIFPSVFFMVACVYGNTEHVVDHVALTWHNDWP
jgi:hypothetical protein